MSHRSDPELNLADDVELFLIIFSSLAMRGLIHLFLLIDILLFYSVLDYLLLLLLQES